MADPGAAPHIAAAALCRSCHASGRRDIGRNDRYSLDRGAADGGRGFFGAVLFVGAVRSDVACVRRMGRRDDRGSGCRADEFGGAQWRESLGQYVWIRVVALSLNKHMTNLIMCLIYIINI